MYLKIKLFILLIIVSIQCSHAIGGEIICHRIASPYQADSTNIRILLPDNIDDTLKYKVLYILPVVDEANRRFGSGLEEMMKRNFNSAQNSNVQQPEDVQQGQSSASQNEIVRSNVQQQESVVANAQTVIDNNERQVALAAAKVAMDALERVGGNKDYLTKMNRNCTFITSPQKSRWAELSERIQKDPPLRGASPGSHRPPS